MPKNTFHKLKKEKKQRIAEAFLREFAIKPFDEASLTEVVKQLGIAKGSMYQYFEDKLDLYTYLIAEAGAVKARYVMTVQRTDFPDFWHYFRELYVKGYQFDAENPLESHFLHGLLQNLHSPSVKPLFEQSLEQSVKAFEKMVLFEIEQGLFRNDLTVKTMGFMLYKLGASVQEQLEYMGIINPLESIGANEPVYKGKKEELLRIVDEYIAIGRMAFDKP